MAGCRGMSRCAHRISKSIGNAWRIP
jgi:hypothetical protein